MYTDEYILNLLKQDREKAAQILVKQYSALLGSVCAQHLENAEDVNECVNDAFAEFFLHSYRYDPTKSSLKAYLCTIANHKAVDLFRKNLRKIKLESELLSSQKDVLTNKKTHAKEIEQLNEAMDKLPPLDQQILKMHYYDDLSYKEISEELNLGYETVKKRGLRGKKKLLYLILLGLLIIGITACTTIVMKKQGLLPTWFPFYDILPGNDSTETDSTAQNNGYIKNRIPSLPTDKSSFKNTMLDSDTDDTTSINSITSTNGISGTGTKYYFSSTHGLLSSDTPAYRLTSETKAFTKTWYSYELKDALYYDGELEIIVDFTSLDSTIFTKDRALEIHNFLKNSYVLTSDQEQLSIGSADAISTDSSYTLRYTLPFYGTLDENKADTLYLSLVFPDGNSFDLTLTKQDPKEYEDSSNENLDEPSNTEQTIQTESAAITLKTGISATENDWAIVELYQMNIGDYEVEDFITQSYRGSPYPYEEKPVLIDTDGNIYPRIRTTSQYIQTETGTDKRFQIYFRNVEAGEYTLSIPRLCLRKNLTSETARIPLPIGEDDYLECDVTISFPDGSGFHITGIERDEDFSNDPVVWDEVNECFKKAHYWRYRPIFETFSSDEDLEFCFGTANGVDSNGAFVTDQITYWAKTGTFGTYS